MGPNKDVKDRLSSALADRYEIEEEIGSGGMATVYLADDLRHERKVALKVLKPELAAAVGAERFLSEIKTTAGLQHPHILPLFDSGEADGLLFYVMPYVEGESLRERIAREGALPVDEAVRILRDVADGLAHAHGRGLIHRDIKPGNVLLSGRHATIADFGIAKALISSATRADHTATGVAIGTPKYMAPEQASGTSDVGHATDIYAFGVLAYEALSGQAPFRGSTPHQILARQLTETPTPMGELRPELPAALDALVMRCLERDPADRWQSAHELLRELEGLASATGSQTTVSGSRARRRVAPAFVLGLAIGTGLLAYVAYRGPEAAPPQAFRLENVRRVTIMPGSETGPSLSPDGGWVAFAADASGNKDIWIKNLEGGDPIQLTTHPSADYDPAWSPDGSTIVFRSNRSGGGLYSVPAFSGEAVRLVDLGFRPRWSPDGTQMLFQMRARSLIPNEVYLMDYPPRAEPSTLLDWEENGDPFYLAEWSPDGAHVLFRTGSYVAESGLAIRGVDPPGDEFFLLTPDGEQVVAGSFIWAPGGRGLVMSWRGSLAFVALDEDLQIAEWPPRQLTTGSTSVPHYDPATSHDGTLLAFSSSNSQSDIWKVRMDPQTGLSTGDPIAVIDHPAGDREPILLPDGRHFLFLSDRGGDGLQLFVADTAGNDVRLVDGRRWRDLYSVSPDGRWVVGMLATSPIQGHLLPFDPSTQQAAGPGRTIVASNGAQARYGGTNWSPEGTRLMVVDYGDNSLEGVLMIEDPVGVAPTEILWPVEDDFRLDYPHMTYAYSSPDGEWISFGAYKERHRPSVFAIRAGSSEPKLIWVGSGHSEWMGDAGRIHIWGEAGFENEDELGFVPFDPVTGETTGDLQILDLRPTHGDINLYEASLSADRRWLFFGYTQRQGDVYVGEIRQDR